MSPADLFTRSALPTRRLADAEVSAIGLGAMPMSLHGRPSEEQSIATIHAALDAGATLIDTANSYALDESEVGHNELLVAKALRQRSERVLVATKGGIIRRGEEWLHNGHPDSLRRSCEASLRRLGVERIDLFQFHRPDLTVPYEESVGALAELQQAGMIRWVGLSNANVAQLELALTLVDVVSIQNQLSPRYPFPLARGEVAATADRGIAFLAWSPLGGIGRADSGSRIAPIRAAAERHGVSAQQVVLAWLLALSPTIIPIPGATRSETIRDSLAAATLVLDTDELAAISAAVDEDAGADVGA
jgi:aryl-alcohol dehydrogenase-like predicted oxidoreductase